MNLSPRHLLMTIAACGSVATLILACSSTESTFPEEPRPVPMFPDASFSEGGLDEEDLYKNDPPREWCGPDAGAPPPQPGGTESCPDDKNLPGCGCANPGEEATCWTGLRKHRNLGICKDGRTRCYARNETENVWAACEGQVLPTLGAKGAEACMCFSAGEWNIANTSPCLREFDGAYWSHATVLDDGRATYCTQDEAVPAGTSPPGIWSTSTLNVDCAGTFRLCFRIRAGDYDDPKDSDCVLGEACIDADYPEAGVVQTLPDLPTWAGKDAACAKKWELDTPKDVSPGYGEMIVKGQTVHCEDIDDGSGNDYVFHRVQYCPRICRASDKDYNPDHPACKACQLANKGRF